jgi:hypothetical protein
MLCRRCISALQLKPTLETCRASKSLYVNKYAEMRFPMTETKLTIADIILIAGTRVVLGAGIGLLVSTRLNNDQRKAAGLSLALVGGLTTIPLALGVIGKHRGSQAEFRQAA